MSVVDDIKQRIDVIDLVTRYTPLTRAGSTYKGLCPFHSERTPSFVVFPHTGTWRCFGACGIGGDVFTFLMRAENLDFREALAALAKEAGVDLEQHKDDPERDLRARLHRINEQAALFFEAQLAGHPDAAVARAYLDRRQIDAATTKQFRLGFALDGWDHLRNHLLEQGFAVEEQLQAGLLKQHEERKSLYDLFRGRLMIPICDRQGRVIGFGGRVLEDRQPKYLNSPETPIFHKSHVVYALDKAYRAITQHDRVVIVEGYMDAIAAHQHGFQNVVACMGTAVTAEQLQQLERYSNNFVLALDADTAGQQATIRALNQARQALARVRKPRPMPNGRIQMVEQLAANLAILSMPDGKDPDDVIRKQPDRWSGLVDQAQPLVDYYFTIVAGQYDLETPQGKGAAVSELVGLIAELGDDIERQHYIQQLAHLVRVADQTIEARVQAAITTMRATGRVPGSPELRRRPEPAGASTEPAGQATAPQRRPPPVAIDHEDHLLANLLHQPRLLIWLTSVTDRLEMSALAAADLRRIENQEILHTLKRYINSDEPWDLELFQEQLADQLHGHLGRLMAYGLVRPPSDDSALREDTVKVFARVRHQRLTEQTVSIGFLLNEAQAAGNSDELDRYKRINNQLLRELFHLQSIQAKLSDILFDRGRQREGVKLR